MERLRDYRRVLEVDPNNFNADGIRGVLAAGLQPGVVAFGASVAEMEKNLTDRCGKTTTRRIDPPFLPDVKTKQMQIDCDGLPFLGKDRWSEFVFRDDALQMVWIMITPEEEQSIMADMTEVYGAPTRRNERYAAFTQGRAALRFKPAEVLFYSEEIAPHIARWFD